MRKHLSRAYFSNVRFGSVSVIVAQSPWAAGSGQKRPVAPDRHMYRDAIMNVGIHNTNNVKNEPPTQTITQLEAVFQKTDLLRYLALSA
jgi:hypothetical protein